MNPKRIPLDIQHLFGRWAVDGFRSGPTLGYGCSRVVHDNEEFRKGTVAKFAIRGQSEANWTEWLIWQAIGHMEIGNWLAPCRSITMGGTVLVQDRTGPVAHEELPESVPNFFTDLKPSNWGKLPDGRVVCHDYASFGGIMMGLAATRRMKRAQWTYPWKEENNGA